jgi:hypothetical protein
MSCRSSYSSYSNITPTPYTPIGSATFIATQCGDGQNIDGTSENTRYIWHYVNEYPAV